MLLSSDTPLFEPKISFNIVMLSVILSFGSKQEEHLQSSPLKNSVKVTLSYVQLSHEQLPDSSHEQSLHIYEFSRLTASNTDKDCAKAEPCAKNIKSRQNIIAEIILCVFIYFLSVNIKQYKVKFLVIIY